MPRKPVNLDGQRFGMLTVQGITDQRNSYGRLLYRCKCDCGGERLATAANLKDGEVTNCGCRNHLPKRDLAGQRFGRLLVLKRTVIPDDSRSSYNWLCRCDCGNIVEVNGNSLTSGNTISCGCAHRDAVKSLYVDGTAPCKLTESKNPRKSNTSGVTGVSFNQGKQKWDAEIMLKGKKICLGRYEKKEDAIKARLLAEEAYFGPILEQAEAEAAAKDESPGLPVEPDKKHRTPKTSLFSVGDVIVDWQVLCQSESYVSPKGHKHSQWLCKNIKTGERRVFPIFSLVSRMRVNGRIPKQPAPPKESTTVKYPPFDLVSPEGEIYHVESMPEFVRNHVRLFCQDESVPENVAATRAINGIHGLLATAYKGVPYATAAKSYKGWTVQVDPGVKLDAKPRTKAGTYLPADLVSPDGTVYHVERLLEFAREHISEFFPDGSVPEEIAVKRVAIGLGQIIATANGSNKGSPVYAYKGWMVKDPPVPRKSKWAMRGSHLPVDLESPEGKVYHVESPLNFAREHIKDFYQDGTVQDDIAVRRITGGINRIVRGKSTTYKGWKIKKEGNDND